MPFIHFENLDKEFVTPKYSTAYGELVTGESIEVGRLTFKAGEGAVEHAHPHEQVMYVISGKLEVTMDGETAILGPGSGFQLVGRFPEWLEPRVVELVLLDRGPDLGAHQSQLVHRAVQLFCGSSRRLHGKRRKTGIGRGLC